MFCNREMTTKYFQSSEVEARTMNETVLTPLRSQRQNYFERKDKLIFKYSYFEAESCLKVIVHKFACLAFPFNIDVSFQHLFYINKQAYIFFSEFIFIVTHRFYSSCVFLTLKLVLALLLGFFSVFNLWF